MFEIINIFKGSKPIKGKQKMKQEEKSNSFNLKNKLKKKKNIIVAFHKW